MTDDLQTDGGRREAQKGRLDEMRDRLDEVAPRAREAVRGTFEASSGELIIDDESAPDRSDFESYEAWLVEAHSWAIDQLQNRVELLDEVTATMAEQAEEYPELGDRRPAAVEQIDALGDALADAGDLLDAIANTDRELARIEAAYSNE